MDSIKLAKELTSIAKQLASNSNHHRDAKRINASGERREDVIEEVKRLGFTESSSYDPDCVILRNESLTGITITARVLNEGLYEWNNALGINAMVECYANVDGFDIHINGFNLLVKELKTARKIVADVLSCAT